MQFALLVLSPYEGPTPNIVEDVCTGYLCPRKNVVALADKREIPIKDENIGSELESLDVRNARMSSPGTGRDF